MSITESEPTQADDGPLARWVEHPFVKRALERHPDADMVVVLNELLATMQELELRFPGVPFRAILNADVDHDTYGDDVRAGLRACGVETKFIDAVMEPSNSRERFAFYPTAARLADLNLSWQELSEQERLAPAKAKRITSLRTTPTPAQVELAEMVLDEGRSIREVADIYDVAPNTVKWSAMRVMYHRGER